MVSSPSGDFQGSNSLKSSASLKSSSSGISITLFSNSFQESFSYPTMDETYEVTTETTKEHIIIDENEDNDNNVEENTVFK